VIAISVGYGLMFGGLVILPLWLQTTLGYTATLAGEVMAPVGIFAILLSPFIGKILPKVDARWVASTAFLVFAVVFYMRSQFTENVDTFTLMIPTIIQGAAMAMFFIPLTSIILSGQPPEKIPSAAGLSNFVRIMFGGMGTSITSTLWDRRTSLHHSQLTEFSGPHSPAFNEAVHSLTAQGMPEPAAWATIERLITVKAATQGATDIFWISAVLFMILIALVWLTKPSRSSVPVDAGGAH
jgi:DHA2 family multidrug resistance protein